MEQSFKSALKVFSLPLYENYPSKIDPAKLYRYIEINLYDCWNNKNLTVSKKKRYKPIDFKKLYKKLSVLKKQYQKPLPFNWINTASANSQNFSKNSLNISTTSSYLLRALNNSQLYKHQQIPSYKSIFLKGFTFEKEKVLNKKKRNLNDPLFFFYCSKLDKKILRQQKIEKKFFD